MSQPGRGPESLANLNSGTGLAELLSAFVTHGGQLTGARRWPENPLALTHVRWHGPVGQLLDASRHPGDESWLMQGERDAWVQLALHYPATAQPTMPGPAAPWMPLELDRGRAQELLTGMARARHTSNATPGFGAAGYGTPAPRSGYSSRYTAGDAGFGGHSTPFPGGAREDVRPPSWPGDGASPSPWPGGSEYGGSYGAGAGAPPDDPISQMSGGWRNSQPAMQDAVIIPYVEVELPPASSIHGPDDFARDYARDVAVHFARAARTIPQVRELRAWMRGERMALAARMVLGTGGRPLTRAETDGAMQVLADVLAQRTLPFSRIGLAHPAEWQTGSPLPE